MQKVGTRVGDVAVRARCDRQVKRRLELMLDTRKQRESVPLDDNEKERTLPREKSVSPQHLWRCPLSGLGRIKLT